MSIRGVTEAKIYGDQEDGQSLLATCGGLLSLLAKVHANSFFNLWHLLRLIKNMPI